MHPGAAFMRGSYCSSDFCYPKGAVSRSVCKSRHFLFPIAENLWESFSSVKVSVEITRHLQHFSAATDHCLHQSESQCRFWCLPEQFWCSHVQSSNTYEYSVVFVCLLFLFWGRGNSPSTNSQAHSSSLLSPWKMTPLDFYFLQCSNFSICLPLIHETQFALLFVKPKHNFILHLTSILVCIYL